MKNNICYLKDNHHLKHIIFLFPFINPLIEVEVFSDFHLILIPSPQGE